MSQRVVLAALIGLSLVGPVGCMTFDHGPPVDMATLRIRPASDRAGVCPRERTRFEVVGRSADGRIRAISEEGFELSSPEGTFDDFGYFTPNTDLRASVEPIAVTAVMRGGGAPVTLASSFATDYMCIVAAGASGARGVDGMDGERGDRGDKGTSALDANDGIARPGMRGGEGENGTNGGDGAPGPHLRMFVTWVRTAQHDKLLAVRVTGDVTDLVLLPPDAVADLRAVGGDGGNGGRGGEGGIGGEAGELGQDRRRFGGVGGNGGEGGNAGSGGDGGTLDVVYDARYPELVSHTRLDVSGGHAGNAGPGGLGGTAFWDASFAKPYSRSSLGLTFWKGGSLKAAGPPAAMPRVPPAATNTTPTEAWGKGHTGRFGAVARPGRQGTTSVVAGDVSSAFANVPGLAPL
jgi:hypothetical protein